MSKANHRHLAAISAGLALSTFFLWLALRQVDARSLGDAFTAIKYAPMLLCAGALSLSIMLRAVRWRFISGFPMTEQRNFSRATNLGVLTNLLFPGRAGEFIRVVTLANLLRSSLPAPLASAVIDRLIDVFVLLASASFLCWLVPVSAILEKWLTTFLFMCSAFALLVLIYTRNAGIGNAWFARLAKRWLQRWRLQPELFLAELRTEFRRLLGSWLSIELAILAALVLCADYAAIATLLQAFDLSLAFEAPLMLWVFLAAGSALPSAPGYVGIYQVAAVWALSLYAVSATTAVAVATVLQITTLAVAFLMAGPSALGVFKHMSVQNKTS